MAFEPRQLRDMIRALAQDDEARAELARLLQPDEMRELSAEVRALAQAQARTEQRLETLTQRVDELAQAQARTEQRLETLTQRVDELAQRFDTLTQRVDTLTQRVDQLTEQMTSLVAQVAILTDHMGEVRGQLQELRYRDRGHAYFAPIARRLRVLDLDEIDRVLDEAIQRGTLSEADADEVRLADLILRGVRAGEAVLLLVETSATVDERDIQRAAYRAELLSGSGTAVIAVAAGARSTPDSPRHAREGGVWLVSNGVAVPPTDVADAG